MDSRTIEDSQWRLRKAAALVKLLSLGPGRRLHREQLMELLWPDLGPKAAANNLHQALHVARRALTSDPAEGSRYLASEGESLVLCPEGSLWVDVEAFEQSALSARRSRDPAAYRAAIGHFTGDLLPQDRYEEWAEGRRENLHQLYLALLVELAGLYEERDEYGPAIEALRKATAKEPTLEGAHVSLMRLHTLSGRPEQALAQSLSEGPHPPSTPVPEELLADETLSELTPREREVALLVARGLTNRQISTRLSISERTAGNHVARILSKLGLRSRAQVATWATEHRLLMTPESD